MHQYEAIPTSWPKSLHASAVHSETAATSGLKTLYERRKWSNESYTPFLNSLHALHLNLSPPKKTYLQKGRITILRKFPGLPWRVQSVHLWKLLLWRGCQAFDGYQLSCMAIETWWKSGVPSLPTRVGRAFIIACLRHKWHCWFFLLFWDGWPLFQKAHTNIKICIMEQVADLDSFCNYFMHSCWSHSDYLWFSG